MTRAAWAVNSSVMLISLGIVHTPIIPGMATSALAESFNAKSGAWEMSITTLTAGMLIPPDALATMPPEQRAKFEQSMQARSGQPMTRTYKACVTQEDLDQNRIIKEEEEQENELQCTMKVISKSSSKLVIERACPAPPASTSKMMMEAKTPESIVGSLDMTKAESGKVHVDIKGRWLGASCAGIEDRD